MVTLALSPSRCPRPTCPLVTVLFRFVLVLVFSKLSASNPSLTYRSPGLLPVQWIESLLLPPFPHHNDEDDFAVTSGHKKHGNQRLRQALSELFA